ncbi:copper amine oxidase N-terminal domain-containing protein [Paenibacillus sp. R14(2021)]|uniref:copper amine oxidase N-terminal domain-containing protein n=1 Tax=Paenibacillus sp. R14(2021) TaxID=2859228 RepID=UPI001C615508|nr:copper amine oxidase N-terminal domain-containing protein [Paenibacillus sp. R14(2021)]
MKRMKKSLSILLTLSLLVTAVFTFAATAFADDAPQKAPVNTDVAPQIKAYKDLLDLFTQKKPIADIKAKYIADVQKNVLGVDGSIKAGDPVIDENISFVLDNAVAGKLSYEQAQQAVDKGLQWYFYFLIKNLTNTGAKTALTAGDQAGAQAFIDKAALVYTSVLDVTVKATDTAYGTTSSAYLNDTILPAFKSDIEKKDVTSLNVHRQLLDKSLIKVFSFVTLSTAKDIQTLPAAEQPAAVIKGYFYFMSVYGYLHGGNAVDADIIYKAFASGDAKQINYDAIRKAVIRCQIAKVSAYTIEILEKIEKKDIAGAAGTGGELVGFFTALEPFVGDAYKAAKGLNDQVLAAAAAGDADQVRAIGYQMAAIAALADGLFFTAGDTKAIVNGKIQTVVPSFIDKTTNRTLVPTRYLELLGFAVSFNNAAKTASVTKDGVTLALKIGSDVVLKNGEAIADYKLDQAVVVKNNVTYLPLRAIAELSGNHIYFNKGDVVVIK